MIASSRMKVMMERTSCGSEPRRLGGGPNLMSEVVCQVGNQAGQVEFIWSSRGGFFDPYVIDGTRLAELRQAAGRPASGPSASGRPSCRQALERLVFALNQAGDGPTPWE